MLAPLEIVKQKKQERPYTNQYSSKIHVPCSALIFHLPQPLQKENPPSEQALAVMALEALHLTGAWDSFMKVLDGKARL